MSEEQIPELHAVVSHCLGQAMMARINHSKSQLLLTSKPDKVDEYYISVCLSNRVLSMQVKKEKGTM